MTGLKYDQGKLKWELLIMKFFHGVVRVLMFGADKYKPHSWQHIEQGKERYYNALIRHLSELQDENGEINLDKKDEESGFPHLWHLQCNAYFLEYFRQREEVI